MRIIDGFDQVPADAKGASVAIGNFDGVHRGHQALITRAIEAARRIGAPAGVVLFEPHPRVFFRPDLPFFRLTPLDRKLTLLDGLGLDLAVVLRFDAQMAALSAEAFITRVLIDALRVRHIVVGQDFRFGKDRGGSVATLEAAAAQGGFAVTVVEPVARKGEVLSSSGVRQRLGEGDVAGAAVMLGHRWRVAGTVVGGAKRGTGLGFPTANIAMPAGTELGFGIYAVRMHLDTATYDGAGYFGKRPTFDDGAPMLEVFLLDFDGDLYGRSVEVEFVDRIRGDARFESEAALKAQMEADCARARDLLRAACPLEPRPRLSAQRP